MKRERDKMGINNYDREEHYPSERDEKLYNTESYTPNGVAYSISWERVIKDRLRDTEKVLEDERMNDFVEEVPFV